MARKSDLELIREAGKIIILIATGQTSEQIVRTLANTSGQRTSGRARRSSSPQNSYRRMQRRRSRQISQEVGQALDQIHKIIEDGFLFVPKVGKKKAID